MCRNTRGRGSLEGKAVRPGALILEHLHKDDRGAGGGGGDS